MFFFIVDISAGPPGPTTPNPTGIVSTANSSEVTSSKGEVLGASREEVSCPRRMRNY